MEYHDVDPLPENVEPLERMIERHLVRQVERLGGQVRKLQFIGRRGAPDRLVLLPRSALRRDSPCVYWAELKRTKTRASARQREEHAALQAFEQNVLVLHSYDDIDRWLRTVLSPVMLVREGLR